MIDYDAAWEILCLISMQILALFIFAWKRHFSLINEYNIQMHMEGGGGNCWNKIYLD